MTAAGGEGGMTEPALRAANRLAATLRDLDAQQIRLGLAPVSGSALTLDERAWETQLRIDLACNAVCGAHPDDPMPLLEAAGAHLLALMVAVAEAQDCRLDMGDAA